MIFCLPQRAAVWACAASIVPPPPVVGDTTGLCLPAWLSTNSLPPPATRGRAPRRRQTGLGLNGGQTARLLLLRGPEGQGQQREGFARVGSQEPTVTVLSSGPRRVYGTVSKAPTWSELLFDLLIPAPLSVAPGPPPRTPQPNLGLRCIPRYSRQWAGAPARHGLNHRHDAERRR